MQTIASNGPTPLNRQANALRIAVKLVPGDRKDLGRIARGRLFGLACFDCLHRRLAHRRSLHRDRRQKRDPGTGPCSPQQARYQTETTDGNQGISETVVSSAMPRKAARCIIGLVPERLRGSSVFFVATHADAADLRPYRSELAASEVQFAKAG